MFGIPSIGKLLVLAAILGAVWYGFKMVGRMQQARDAERKQKVADSNKASAPAKGGEDTLDLVQCSACQAYVQAGSKCSNCGTQN